MADAGVLDAVTSLMNMLSDAIVQAFNALPEPVRQVIAWFIKIQIWAGIIISVLTTLLGLLIAYIMYLWGLSFVIKIVLFLMLQLSRSLMVFSDILFMASMRLGLFSIWLKTTAADLALHGKAGRFASMMLLGLNRIVLLLSRLLLGLSVVTKITSVATAGLTYVSKGLMFVYNGLMKAVGLYLRFLLWQTRMLFAGTAAVWRFVASKFAATTALGTFSRALLRNIGAMAATGFAALISAGKFIFLGFAAIGASVGLGAASVAGAPFLAIILAIIIGVAALAIGIYFLIRHFKTIVGWFREAISWVMGLNKWFLLLLGPIGVLILALMTLWNIWKKVRGAFGFGGEICCDDDDE